MNKPIKPIVTYDENGKLAYTKSPEGEETFYKCDLNGNVTYIKDSCNMESWFNSDGQETRTKFKDGNERIYSYHSNGELAYEKHSPPPLHWWESPIGGQCYEYWYNEEGVQIASKTSTVPLQ